MALAIDASTPTDVNSVGPSVATASFTPPAGALLLVMFAGNTDVGSGGQSAPSATDNLGSHLTYTLQDWQSRLDSPTRDGQAADWTASVGSSAAMTVTVTNGNSNTANDDLAVKVNVITGQDPVAPIGAHGKSGSASAGTIAQSYTGTAAGSWGFIVALDWDATGSMSAGTGCTLIATGTIPGIVSWGFLRRTTADGTAGGTTTLNATLGGTSTNLSWTYVEVIPAASAAPAAPAVLLPPPLLFEIIAAFAQQFANPPAGVAATPDVGTGLVGISGFATAVKVVAQSSRASFGLSAIATGLKLAPQASFAALGVTERGTAVKVVAQSGVEALSLSGIAAGRKVVAETGNVSVGIAPYGPTQAARAQTGRVTVGLVARATAVHVAIGVARSVLGLSGVGTAAKKIPATGVSAIGLAASGAEVKRATPSSQATVGITERATVAKRATPLANVLVGLSGISAARKVVAVAGLGAVGFAPNGPTQGQRAQTGRCAIGMSGAASVGHKALPLANATIGLATRGVATKAISLPGVTTVGITARAVAAKRATPVGLLGLGLAALGTAKHISPRVGIASFGLSGNCANGKRITTAARALLGVFGYGTPYKPTAIDHDAGPTSIIIITGPTRLKVVDIAIALEPDAPIRLHETQSP